MADVILKIILTLVIIFKFNKENIKEIFMNKLDQETLDEVVGAMVPSICHQDSSLHNRSSKMYG